MEDSSIEWTKKLLESRAGQKQKKTPESRQNSRQTKTSISDRKFTSGVNKITQALLSPFKAAGQVVTANPGEKITKPARTIIDGGVSMVTGFVDLSASITSAFIKEREDPKKNLTIKAHSDDYKKWEEARERIANRYSSLHKLPEIPEKKNPNEPSEYKSIYTINRNGESVTLAHEVLLCSQEHCESEEQGIGRYFYVTSGEIDFILNKFGSRPKFCSGCRFWRYNEQLKGERFEPCEKCGRLFYVTAEEQIMFHKNQGKPLISRKCNCEYLKQQRLADQRQLSLFSNVNRDTIARYIDEREVSANLKEEEIQLFQKKKGIAQVFARIKNNPPMDLPLVDPIEYTNLFTRGSQNVYDHLWKHIVASEDGDTTMARHNNPIGLINYAHSIAHVSDPNRFLEIPDPDNDTHIKYDMTTGEYFFFNTAGNNAYLRSAYVPVPGKMKRDMLKPNYKPSNQEMAKAGAEKLMNKLAEMV